MSKGIETKTPEQLFHEDFIRSLDELKTFPLLMTTRMICTIMTASAAENITMTEYILRAVEKELTGGK